MMLPRSNTVFRPFPVLAGRMVVGFALLAVLLQGCGREELETVYGRHRRPGQSGSVNGTDVLAAMFEQAGHDVHFRRTLVTDEMVDADVVVWFPNDYAPPSEDVCQWFDAWLAEYPARTLVYVGRDFSATPEYFRFLSEHRQKSQKQQPGAGDEKKLPKLPDFEPSTKLPEDANSEWFRYEKKPAREGHDLAGPWARGIDAAKANLELRTRMKPVIATRQLLTSQGEPIVSRLSKRHWADSQVLLVANGSFLLNLPLVNHERRKLAEKLIDAAGEPAEVVFLESGPGGPPIDPPYTDNSLWTLFRGWPLGAILLQLAAVGVIFCFARWPVFGRPKQPPPESTADFAKHVAAVGKLLARTKALPPDANATRQGASRSEHAALGAPTASIPPSIETRANLARRPPALPREQRGH